MNRNLKFSHKIQSLVAIPIVCLFVTLAVLAWAFLQLWQGYEAERNAKNAMAALASLQNHILSSISSQGLYYVTKDPQMQRSYQKGFAAFEQDRRRVSEALKRCHGSEKYIAPLEDTLAEISKHTKIGELAINNEDKFEAMRVIMQLQRLMRKIMKASDEVFASLEQEDRVRSARQAATLNLMLTIVGTTVAANVVMVLLVMTWLRTTSYGLGHLANNINSLGMGHPLGDPIHGADEEIARLDSSLHRVSNLLVQARRKEQSLIDNAQDIICSLDRTGRIKQVNPAASELWGFEKDELVERHVASIVYEPDRDTTSESIKALIEAGANERFENRIVAKSGRVIDMIWNARWSQEDDQLFCVAHDVTERKELERLKQEVVAMVSHDLRSPLTSILMTIDLLEGGAFGELNEKGVKRVARVKSSVATLIELTNDLLDLEKIEAGMFELDKKRVSTTEILTKATSLLTDVAQERDIKLESSSAETELVADYQRTVRVLTNLLSNAIKFSNAGDTIDVKAFENDNTVRFEVIDRGRGIPEGEVQRVFERYRQVDKRDATEKQGSGLGLAICKALVEAHGGTIGVTSKVGEGSCFWLELPKN